MLQVLVAVFVATSKTWKRALDPDPHPKKPGPGP